MSVFKDITNGEYEYSDLNMDDFHALLCNLETGSKKEPFTWTLVTGTYGMYNFEFACGGVGIPDNYIHSGYHKYFNAIYITLIPKGYGSKRPFITAKHSPYKCIVRMWMEISKIELYYRTKLIMTANSFDDINKYMKSLTSL